MILHGGVRAPPPGTSESVTHLAASPCRETLSSAESPAAEPESPSGRKLHFPRRSPGDPATSTGCRNTTCPRKQGAQGSPEGPKPTRGGSRTRDGSVLGLKNNFSMRSISTAHRQPRTLWHRKPPRWREKAQDPEHQLRITRPSFSSSLVSSLVPSSAQPSRSKSCAPT